MSNEVVIALIGLLGVLAVALLNVRTNSNGAHIKKLENDLGETLRKLQHCEDERTDMFKREVELMRQIVRLGGNAPGPGGELPKPLPREYNGGGQLKGDR